MSEPLFHQTASVPWRLLMRRAFLDSNGIRMREVDGTFEDNSFRVSLDVHATRVGRCELIPR